MDREAKKAIMVKMSHFDRLEKDELDIMADHIEFTTVKKDVTLVTEGSLGDSLFYIIDGEIEIKKEALDGTQAILARFRKGATVGEMAIVEKKSTRSATATTIKKTELLMLTRESFDDLSKNHPKIALKVTQNIATMISARLRHTSGRFADVFH